MGRISRRAQQLKKAREIQAQKLAAKKNDARHKINKIISEMDEPKLKNALELITNLNNSEITRFEALTDSKFEDEPIHYESKSLLIKIVNQELQQSKLKVLIYPILERFESKRSVREALVGELGGGKVDSVEINIGEVGCDEAGSVVVVESYI
ncbi:hypothetical protein RhiirA4_467366 [Rhizophagus irregularis]|uniref:Uncharacterized protein n=1 Tax=Rhizophagus irregularis TaxID=588596 RepID=A0A2I1GVS7_9GLOM|nr:hypothetical protein RhiirA4_467366 [Rhizophagus irregularis]